MESDKLVNKENTDHKLTPEELARQKKDYKLVLEALFSDEEDSRLTKHLTIGISVAVAINTLMIMYLAFFK